jgi:iron-sulfur cluster insertion protein
LPGGAIGAFGLRMEPATGAAGADCIGRERGNCHGALYNDAPWEGSPARRLQSKGDTPYVIGMDQTLAAPAFAMSDQAAERIAEIVGTEATPLRVSVLAGGCSGFQYRFELDPAVQPDDLVIEKGAAKVVVDPASLDLLAGAELHFNDALMGSYFSVRNPNATSSCGCGTSFSVD